MGRARDVSLFLALALLPTVAVGVLGLRALEGEEAAQRREAVSVLEASAERIRQRVEGSLAEADAALVAASFGADPEKTLRAIVPPFAVAIALDRGELVLPAPSAARAPREDDASSAACDVSAKSLARAKDPEARRSLLPSCAEARGPDGRFVYPVIALSALHASDVPALVAWLASHASVLSAGERAATREEILSSRSFDETSRAQALAALDASPEAREQVLAALRSEAAAAALRQGPDRVGMMRFRSTNAIGVLRALDSGRMVGFVVSRESLAASLDRGWLDVPSDQRVAASPVLSSGFGARVPFASAPGLELVVLPKDPRVIGERASQSRRVLGAIGASAVAVSLVLLVVLWARVQRARRTSELRVDFVSALSHELRTPASSLRMFAELLAGGHVEAEEQREVFVALDRESLRLVDTLERLLSLGRMAKGKLEATRREGSVAEVAAQAIDAFEARFPEEPRVVREMEPDASAPIDPALLRLAIDNLLDNAQKYAPEGKPYRVSVARERSSVVVRVSDRGPGIARRDQRRIFSPFERLDDKLSRKTEGSGLGLSLVKHVARLHGGDARVESEPGQGATFVLTIDCKMKGLRGSGGGS